MTSINDSLSTDLLFNTFKSLDSFQITIARRVCKQWFQIIDEHKSFWRTLHLPKDSLKKWDPSILQLFDNKSDSTLEGVEIRTEVKEDSLVEFFSILQKSNETLKYLHFTFYDAYNVSRDRLDILGIFIKVECLMLLNRHRVYKVRLRRRSIESASQEDGSNTASPLKVLWYGTGGSILKINNDRFQNLASLDSGAELSSSEWRTFLEGPSRSLKHLRFSFHDDWDDEDDEDDEGSGTVPMLHFPNLEVLEIDHGTDFPRWFLFPDSVKVIAYSPVYNLPSISELWSWNPFPSENDIIDRLPKLKTIVLLSFSYPMEKVIEALEERKGNVEAGLQVDGVQMEMIKTLIVPFDLIQNDLSDQYRASLRRCRELVEVVEGDSPSRFMEVEY